MNTKKLLKIAEDASQKSAKILMDHFQNDTVSRIKKDDTLVTEADMESEKEILSHLKKHTPEYSILSEEAGLYEVNASKYLWIVDPLDGTLNYAQKIPLFAVQIALVHHCKVVLGVINLPYENIIISAIKGEGVFINGTKVKPSEISNPQSLMLFETYLDEVDLKILKSAAGKIKNVRIINSACVSMAYLALGRANLVIDRVDKPWDLAAGSLIAAEAGAKVTNLNGSEFDVFNPECVATHGFNHETALNFLK